MTRDELIRRIEAGDAGPELLCAIAREVRWMDSDNIEAALALGCSEDEIINAGIPDWLHRTDAAVALVGNASWAANNEGIASVSIDGNNLTWCAHVPDNPAAALVAAWLTATA